MRIDCEMHIGAFKGDAYTWLGHDVTADERVREMCDAPRVVEGIMAQWFFEDLRVTVVGNNAALVRDTAARAYGELGAKVRGVIYADGTRSMEEVVSEHLVERGWRIAAAESCTGSDAACPVDAFQPSTVECRASTAMCDPAENCTGSAAACPPDAVNQSAPATRLEPVIWMVFLVRVEVFMRRRLC